MVSSGHPALPIVRQPSIGHHAGGELPGAGGPAWPRSAMTVRPGNGFGAVERLVERSAG
jgi:hypothetical protein